jgi:hypothetical protein
MIRSVCFSSQPLIVSGNNAQMPAIDIVNLRLNSSFHKQSGILNRISRIFGSRALSKKNATAPLTPIISNALKTHMNILTNLMPNTSASCHVLNTNNFDAGSTAIIASDPSRSADRRKSTAFTISEHIKQDCLEYASDDSESESEINFMPLNRRRSSIIHLNSQPILRVKGSPCFPHRTVPTSSLNALEDNNEGV